MKSYPKKSLGWQKNKMEQKSNKKASSSMPPQNKKERQWITVPHYTRIDAIRLLVNRHLDPNGIDIFSIQVTVADV